jgi:hypothetical protein
MRQFIGAGPLGPFIGPAGDESLKGIVGGGPSET